MYLIFLLYLFAGVAIASDMFMDGIMAITATKRKVKRKNPATGEVVVVEEPVWNWVVANITLMALGTSSPEIMLAVVEALLTLGQPAGELGPSCIAGSAAYNFLMISAVCMVALPDGQYKKISQLRVYVTTAAWSLWAYIWMLVVYVWWTPDQVTITEALLTLAFFALMVLNAWIVDKQPWKKSKVLPSSAPGAGDKDPEAPAGDALVAADAASQPVVVAAAAEAEAAPPALQSPALEAPVKTLAHYRHILAARQRAAHRRSAALHGSAGAGEFVGSELEGGQLPGPDQEVDVDVVLRMDPTKEQVMFRSKAYSFLESVGAARVAVTRTPPEGGSLDRPLRVHYRTEDGDAVAGLDYVAREGVLYFAPGEASKYIEVPIIDDDMSEPDVWFSVLLLSAERPGTAGGGGGGWPGDGGPGVVLAQDRVRVTIVDDDDAGVIGFELPEYEIGFNDRLTYGEVTLVRRRGADGCVEVEYETQDMTAVAGEDYIGVKGAVRFENGEKTQKIRVQLLPTFVPEAHKALRLQLTGVSGGAELGRRARCKVTVVRRQHTLSKPAIVAPAKEGLEIMTLPNGSLKVDARELSRQRTASGAAAAAGAGAGTAGAAGSGELWRAWREQIVSAFSPDEPEEEGAQVGWGALVLQYVHITWKVILFTVVPPANWLGGYPCFAAALLMIVGIVYLVNEAGSLFGCIIGLKEVIVGISIVAVGTSLPDTFASRIAAQADPDADAAIGNITGSNGVNVFLGLGLPWTICSIYYAAKGETYVTPGGDLEFAILLYAILGSCGIVILAVARMYGGELGGPKRRQYGIASVLVVLWILYLILSGLRAYGHI